MKYLDYIYYRVTRAYKSWKWEKDPQFVGVLSVSLIVSMLLVDLYGFIHLNFFFEKYGNSYKEQAKVIGLILSILILAFFSIRYHKRYVFLQERWANETKNQKLFRGFLVFLAILLPLLLPVLYLSLFRE